MKEKPPIRLGVLGIIMMSLGASLVCLLAIADTVLTMTGHPEGLPEVVSQGVFGVANLVIGSGATCLAARSDGKNGHKEEVEE